MAIDLPYLVLYSIYNVWQLKATQGCQKYPAASKHCHLLYYFGWLLWWAVAWKSWHYSKNSIHCLKPIVQVQASACATVATTIEIDKSLFTETKKAKLSVLLFLYVSLLNICISSKAASTKLISSHYEIKVQRCIAEGALNLRMENAKLSKMDSKWPCEVI